LVAFLFGISIIQSAVSILLEAYFIYKPESPIGWEIIVLLIPIPFVSPEEEKLIPPEL
jgi:hypothetical protein